MSDFSFNTERIWRVCKRCVEVLDMRASFSRYNFATAMLLFGTAAQESNLKWERQRSPRWDGSVGGFSKWQLEQDSIQLTLNAMRQPHRWGRTSKVTKVVFNDSNAPIDWLANSSMKQILWGMRIEDNDHLGVVFAREHYRRVPALIPVDDGDLLGTKQIMLLAEYWKDHYNTYLGAGTPEQFIHNWVRLCNDTVLNDPLYKEMSHAPRT